jgi:biopolymer transport protein ExbD
MARRRVVEPGQLNLIPVMNLMALLIPFLLMSAQFVSYAVIDTVLPTLAEPVEPEDGVAGGRPQPILIDIGREGFMILGAGDVLEDGPLVPCHGTCDQVESFDLEGLTRQLAKVKDARPEREDVILSPESWVPYELVVLVMDAARADVSSLGPDGVGRTLFPRVVIAARGD